MMLIVTNETAKHFENFFDKNINKNTRAELIIHFERV